MADTTIDDDMVATTNSQPVGAPAQPSVMQQRKTLNQWGRDELLKLPTRAWDAESEYDSLLLLSTCRKHESGWAIMAIVGVREGQPVEIACACCDDIEWKLPRRLPAGGSGWRSGLRHNVAIKLPGTQ